MLSRRVMLRSLLVPYLPIPSSLNSERIVYVVDVLQDCGGAMRHVNDPACFRLTNSRMPDIVLLLPEDSAVTEFFRAGIAMFQDVEIVMTRRPRQ